MKNTFFRKAAALALTGIMSASLLAGCGSTKIDGTQTVVTVGDEEIELGVVSFYAKYQQALLYKYYSSYLGTAEMFDTEMEATSDNDGETYGEQMRNTALEDVEKMVVISQHAEEYEVSLTEEEEAAIEEAAQAYIDNNSEEVREKIGASLEHVKKLLELQTIQSKMMDPIAQDVDTEVSQEEAQQSKVTYIAITPETDTTAEATESTDTVDEEDASDAAMATAEAVLQAIQAEEDIANADMSTIAAEIDDSLSAVSGHYTTNDTTDGSVDSEVVAAVAGLDDGTLVDHVITGSDGETLYVARFDLLDDEEYTETTKSSIIRTRKQEAYDTITDGWMEETEIKVDQSVLKTLQLTDTDPITLADAVSEEETVEEAVSEAESVEEAAESVPEATSDASSTAS